MQPEPQADRTQANPKSWESSSSQGPPLPLQSAPPYLSPADRGQQGLGKPRQEQPSCGGGIREQLLGDLQPGKALRPSCPRLPRPSQTALSPTAARSSLEAAPSGAGGMSDLERGDLIPDPEPVGGTILDYPKPSLGPGLVRGTMGLPAQARGGTGGIITPSDTGTFFRKQSHERHPHSTTALQRPGCYCPI